MRAVVEVRNGCVYTISADTPCEILVVDHDDQMEVAGRPVSSATIWELRSSDEAVPRWFAQASEQGNTGYLVSE